MANENKISGQQPDDLLAESNAERDQDHGNMNNGTIGGNMGTIGNSNDENKAQNSKKSPEDEAGPIAGEDGSVGTGNTR
jgi:hypothetical protein